MPKNLVICFDGTANKFGNENSNTVKLYSVLSNDESYQLTLYEPGVGTFGQRDKLFEWQNWLSRLLGYAFGWGLKHNIEIGYNFLAQNYQPGDRIFLFGFSRGAYTARALSGLIDSAGLLRSDLLHLYDYAWTLYKEQHKKQCWIARLFKKIIQCGNADDTNNRLSTNLVSEFKRIFSRQCSVHFLGLFDTVKSVGWVYTPAVLPNTAHSPNVSVVRHAVSIDERRNSFRQNLWAMKNPPNNVKQVWFAGVHSDIGGGYPENESGLSKIALQWMLKESIQEGLVVDKNKLDGILGLDPQFSKPDPNAVMHKSLVCLWWIAELLPRRFADPNNHYKERWLFPLLYWKAINRPRFIADGAELHSSVIERMNSKGAYYKPVNLPANYTVLHD